MKIKNITVRGKFADGTFPKNVRASTIRRKMLRKSAQMFKRSRILSGNAIRCRQYRDLKKDAISNDPFESITYLQESAKYGNSIRRIGWKPFKLLVNYKAVRKW